MKWVKALLALAIVLLGAGALVFMVKSRPPPGKKVVSELGDLVTVTEVRPTAHELVIEARGVVLPARQVIVQTEVVGRVVWQNDELVPGGRLAQGATVVRVDGREYRLAAEQLAASVEQAELALKVERTREELARDEWNVIGEDRNASDLGRDIALRKPQLAAAVAGVESAKSARARAQLSVGRTAVTAPFNAWVQAENVEVGQLVSPSVQLATLIGTDAYWVRVSLPTDKLGSFDIPGFNATEGAKVTITQEVGTQKIVRTGRVIRLYGDLDPVGHMARILVEVADPLGLSTQAAEQSNNAKTASTAGEAAPSSTALPLLLGAYVRVVIAGHGVAEAIELPRKAMRDGQSVYLFGNDSRLEIRPVELLWGRADTVLLKAGLAPGERVVTSRIGAPIAGMLLRLPADDAKSPEAVPPPAVAPPAEPDAEPPQGGDDSPPLGAAQKASIPVRVAEPPSREN
jgi:RND family efflux transporter MFP subunit